MSADGLFDEWYDKAKAYAQGMGVDRTTIANESAAVISRLIGRPAAALEEADGANTASVLRRLVAIFVSKPKFTLLLESARCADAVFVGAGGWLAAAATASSAGPRGLPSSLRCESARALTSLLVFSRQFAESPASAAAASAASTAASAPALSDSAAASAARKLVSGSLSLERIVGVVLSSAEEDSTREAVGELLLEAAACHGSGSPFWGAAAMLLACRASDFIAFRLMWRLLLLASLGQASVAADGPVAAPADPTGPAVGALIARLAAARGTAFRCAGFDTQSNVSVDGPSLHGEEGGVYESSSSYGAFGGSSAVEGGLYDDGSGRGRRLGAGGAGRHAARATAAEADGSDAGLLVHAVLKGGPVAAGDAGAASPAFGSGTHPLPATMAPLSGAMWPVRSQPPQQQQQQQQQLWYLPSSALDVACINALEEVLFNSKAEAALPAGSAAAGSPAAAPGLSTVPGASATAGSVSAASNVIPPAIIRVLAALDAFQPRASTAGAAAGAAGGGDPCASSQLPTAPLTAGGQPLERSEAWLRAVRLLLEDCPHSPAAAPLWGRLLAFPTTASLSLAASLAGVPSPHTWRAVLLRRLLVLLAHMPPSVSGSQEDQAAVTLLREGCMAFLDRAAPGALHSSPDTAHTGAPARAGGAGRAHTEEEEEEGAAQEVATAQAFVCAIAAAMGRGYAETERFPELLVALIRGAMTAATQAVSEASGGHRSRTLPAVPGPAAVAAWIPSYILSAEATRSPIGLQAGIDTVVTLLGCETVNAGYGVAGANTAGGSNGLGEATGSAKATADAHGLVDSVLMALAQPQRPSAAATGALAAPPASPAAPAPFPPSLEAVWRELADHQSNFLKGQEGPVRRLLLTVRDTLALADAARLAVCAPDGASAGVLSDRDIPCFRLLLSLSGAVTPGSAPLLLECVMTLLAELQQALLLAARSLQTQARGARVPGPVGYLGAPPDIARAAQETRRASLEAACERLEDVAAAAADAMRAPPLLRGSVEPPPAAALPLSPSVLHALIMSPSPLLRRSAARLLPLRMLTDTEGSVRLAALRELQERMAARAAPAADAASPSAEAVLPAQHTAVSLSAAVAMLRACPPDDTDADSLLHVLLAHGTSSARLGNGLSVGIAAGAALPSSALTSHVLAVSGALTAEQMVAVLSGEAGASGWPAGQVLRPLYAHCEDAATALPSLLKASAPVLATATIAVVNQLWPIHPADSVSGGTAETLCVALLSAVVGRLLRAAAVTAESTALNAPDPSVLVALTALATQLPPHLLHSYALTDGGLSRLRLLGELCAPWLAVADRLVSQHYIAAGAASIHYGSVISPAPGPASTRGPSSSPGSHSPGIPPAVPGWSSAEQARYQHNIVGRTMQTGSSPASDPHPQQRAQAITITATANPLLSPMTAASSSVGSSTGDSADWSAERHHMPRPSAPPASYDAAASVHDWAAGTPASGPSETHPSALRLLQRYLASPHHAGATPRKQSSDARRDSDPAEAAALLGDSADPVAGGASVRRSRTPSGSLAAAGTAVVKSASALWRSGYVRMQELGLAASAGAAAASLLPAEPTAPRAHSDSEPSAGEQSANADSAPRIAHDPSVAHGAAVPAEIELARRVAAVLRMGAGSGMPPGSAIPGSAVPAGSTAPQLFSDRALPLPQPPVSSAGSVTRRAEDRQRGPLHATGAGENASDAEADLLGLHSAAGTDGLAASHQFSHAALPHVPSHPVLPELPLPAARPAAAPATPLLS